MILRAFLPVLAVAAALLGAVAAYAQDASPPMPFGIARVQKDFPATLYSAPNCKDPCEQARALLNRRSVPFAEIQVWNEETLAKLNSVSDAGQLPVLTVGSTVLVGFDPGKFDEALTLAGYPPAGTYPALKQAAPALPEGYTGPEAAAAKAAAAKKPPAPAPKAGPYDTSGLVGPAPKQGPYDPSGLQGPAPKQGPYGVPQ